jgi:hypothetical protein
MKQSYFLLQHTFVIIVTMMLYYGLCLHLKVLPSEIDRMKVDSFDRRH